jgi:hypothetical protein
MRKFLTLILMLLSTFTIGLNAKTVFIAASGNNTSGNSWTNALNSIPNSGSSAIAAGDSVFVKGGVTGTYSFSASVSGNSAFATKADVNYLGGFDGSETYSSQRAKSDLDNNGIIEPWEFTNATTLSFNSTNNAYGLYINSNTAKRIFDGFTITGTLNVGQLSASTGGNNMVKINNFTSFQNNILSNCTLSAAPNTATANMGYTKGALIFMGQPTTTTGGSNTVDNCLIENNISTVTPTATQTQDVQQSPFVHIDASNTTGRNVLSNCVFRKNQITLEYKDWGGSSYNNPRGMLVSMSIYGSSSLIGQYNCIKNLLVHNNSATFNPKTGALATTNLGNGGLIFTYNTAQATYDSILNCTVANNSMMRIGYAIRGGFSNTTQPYHVIANNVLLDNKNDNGTGTISVQNLAINQAPAGTAGTITIANNIGNGGISATANVNNVFGNITDLSTTNNNAKGSYFSAPTSINGYSTDASVATSRWTIGSSSYLKAKGYSLVYKTDKAGFAFVTTPSVGAYEQYTPFISGATTTTAFTSDYGTASSSQSFSVSGTKLYGNLVATAPIGYEVSTNGSSYGTTATISRGTGNPSGTIYMRLKSTNNAGNYNAVNTVLSTTDGTSVNIVTPVSGNTVSPKALTIGAASIASKVYDGSNISGTVTPGALSGFVGSETVTVSSAVGTYPDANVETGKTATIVYALANGANGGLATNYSLANGTATGNITAAAAPLTGGNLNNSGLSDAQLANTNLTISSGEFVIDATKTVQSLTVSPGAKLTLSSGTLTATNGITLQSDPTGTATFVDTNTSSPLVVSGTVQQHVSAGRNWYVTVPGVQSNSQLFSSSALNRGTSVVCFDEPSGTWIAPVDGKLDLMRGYIQVATSTPSVTGTTGTVDFSGKFNTGAYSINLTRTEGKSGYNLVGNPYPSYLNWNMVTKTNVSNTMWYRTKEGGVYKFYTYVANSGAGVGSPATVTNKIPPMQAFWVKVNTVGSGSIAVDNDMRSHFDDAGNIMKAPKQSAQKLIRLQVSNGINTDEAVVYFNANALDTFDQYDALKRSNGEPSLPEIFTQAGAEQVVINGMTELKYSTEIPVGFKTGEANNFIISANEISNFEAGTKVILIDKQNPTAEIDLSNGAAYNFSAPVTTVNTDRFSLLFRAPGVTTSINNTENSGAQVFVNAANQITIIAPEKANYSIYNAVGQLVSNGKTITNRTIVNTIRLAGVYVVKLTENGTELTTRVIVK